MSDSQEDERRRSYPHPSDQAFDERPAPIRSDHYPIRSDEKLASRRAHRAAALDSQADERLRALQRRAEAAAEVAAAEVALTAASAASAASAAPTVPAAPAAPAAPATEAAEEEESEAFAARVRADAEARARARAQARVAAARVEVAREEARQESRVAASQPTASLASVASMPAAPRPWLAASRNALFGSGVPGCSTPVRTESGRCDLPLSP